MTRLLAPSLPRVTGVAVYPNFGAIDTTRLGDIIGGLLTVVLLLAIGTLIVSAVTWAIATTTGALQTATRARTGILIALGTAILASAGVTWLHFLLHLGPTL